MLTASSAVFSPTRPAWARLQTIAAVATPVPHHPSSQGFVQSLGVFIDTILICTATSVMILLSGNAGPRFDITERSHASRNECPHWRRGTYFIAIAIFFFAFTSIIGNYSYAEKRVDLSWCRQSPGSDDHALRHASNGGLGRLREHCHRFRRSRCLDGPDGDDQSNRDPAPLRHIAKLTKDYFKQRKQGLAPVFHARITRSCKARSTTDLVTSLMRTVPTGRAHVPAAEHAQVQSFREPHASAIARLGGALGLSDEQIDAMTAATASL